MIGRWSRWTSERLRTACAVSAGSPAAAMATPIAVADERNLPEERTARQQRNRAQHDRDLQANLRGVEKRRAARDRVRLLVELFVLGPDAVRLALFFLGLQAPFLGDARALRSDQLRQLRVGGVHVRAVVLGLEERPAVGGLRLLHRLLGVEAVAHQRHARQQRRHDRHRQPDRASGLAVRLLGHFGQLLCFHGDG